MTHKQNKGEIVKQRGVFKKYVSVLPGLGAHMSLQLVHIPPQPLWVRSGEVSGDGKS